MVDSTWDTPQLRSELKKKILETPLVNQAISAVCATWRDVRLCEGVSQGARKAHAMYPKLDVGNITLSDLQR